MTLPDVHDLFPYLRALSEIVSLFAIGNAVLQNAIQFVQLGLAGWTLMLSAPVEQSQILWSRYSDVALPVSLIVPAYNEEATIVASIRSLLALQYPDFEVIVVNDGSKDDTVARLIDHFDLKPMERAYQPAIPCTPIRQMYGSHECRNLVIVDKENGGKADALNAGINIARTPLVCAIDADSILEPDSLIRATKPFVKGGRTVVAVGGTVRVVNGCTLKGGRVTEVGLSLNLVALFQTVEYLRAFLLARLAWSRIGALTLISGAFGIFRRNIVLEVGGYSRGTVGEDLELIIKVHRHLQLAGRRYTIEYIPEPVCWTEVPSSLRVLASQRSRWQRGALETFAKHKGMLCHPRHGRVGVIGLGHMLLVDVLGPPIEVAGYVLIPLLWALGMLSVDHLLAFAAMVFMFGVFLSVSALILEDLELRRYPKARHLLVLTAVAVLENFGYRQLNTVFRVMGLWQYLRGTTGWGRMKRVGFKTR